MLFQAKIANNISYDILGIFTFIMVIRLYEWSRAEISTPFSSKNLFSSMKYIYITKKSNYVVHRSIHSDQLHLHSDEKKNITSILIDIATLD